VKAVLDAQRRAQAVEALPAIVQVEGELMSIEQAVDYALAESSSE
jgi:hypothetical protein